MPIIYLDLAEVNNVVTVHSTVAGRSFVWECAISQVQHRPSENTKQKTRRSLDILKQDRSKKGNLSSSPLFSLSKRTGHLYLRAVCVLKINEINRGLCGNLACIFYRLEILADYALRSVILGHT